MNFTKQERAALDAALFRQEIEIDEQTKEELLTHLHLVVEFNKTLNLTRITNIEDAIVLHIEDSLSAYREFTSREGRFLDIGTGGGFPGLPLALVTDKQGVLLDSVKKKAESVNKIIHKMNKNSQISVSGCRSEEYAQKHRGEFEIVIARAVSSLSSIEEYASPFLKEYGIVISMRGVHNDGEFEAGLKAAETLGLQFVEKRQFLLNGTYQRSIYTFQKVSEPLINLPRRNGMAHKKPLGL